MPRVKDITTRREISEKIETSKREMEGKEAVLNKVASDLDTVRQTLENLNLGGTAEGTEQVESAIESAKDVTTEVFNKEDQSLEEIHTSNEEFEGKLQEHRGSSESDLGKISDASARIETKEAISELAKAKEAALRDVDFLREQVRMAEDAREKSDAVQEKLQSRVYGGGKGR